MLSLLTFKHKALRFPKNSIKGFLTKAKDTFLMRHNTSVLWFSIPHRTGGSVLERNCLSATLQAQYCYTEH